MHKKHYPENSEEEKFEIRQHQAETSLNIAENNLN